MYEAIKCKYFFIQNVKFQFLQVEGNNHKSNTKMMLQLTSIEKW